MTNERARRDARKPSAGGRGSVSAENGGPGDFHEEGAYR